MKIRSKRSVVFQIVFSKVYINNDIIHFMDSHKNKLWIKIDGNIVDNHKIEIQPFSKILENIQKVVGILQEIDHPNIKKNSFKLYLASTYESSFLSEIQSSPQYDLLNNEPIFNNILLKFKNISLSLNESDSSFIDTIEDVFEEPVQILKFLKAFRGILSKNNYRVYTTFTPEIPTIETNYIILPYGRDELIDELIKKYTSQALVQKLGIIIRLKGDYPRKFVIETIDGEMITCEYSHIMEESIHGLYKTPILIEGIVNQKIKTMEMEEIHKIEPFNSKEEIKIGEFELKTPMNIEVSYDKDNENWVLSNTDIMVYGRGTKLSDAEISFADGFERLLIGFLMFENDELSPKSQKIKKDLEKHINIEKYTHLINFEWYNANKN